MYFLFSLICLIFSAYFFYRASGSLSPKKMNMISWVFWYSLVIQSFIASILVVYNIDGHYGVQKIYFEESRVKGWLAVQYCMVALPLSMWVTLIFLKKRVSNKGAWNSFISKKLSSCITTNDLALRRVFYLFSIVCVLSVFYSFFSVGMYPFQGYISGGNISGLRQSVTREFGGIVYLKNIFGLALTPILSYIFYCYYRLYKEKIDLVFFVILFLSSIAIVSFDYAKSPLAFYLLGFFFIKISLGDNINYIKLLKYFIAILGLLVIFYILTGYQDTVISLFNSYNSGLVGRLTISQAFGTYLAFDLYPIVYDHIGFSSLTDLFGESRERMAREIMLSVNSQGISDGTAGVVNTLFVAEAWANFGLIGVILSVIWVGFLIQVLYSSIIYSRKTPVVLGVYAYLTCKLPITGGFNDFFYNPVLFISIVLIFGIVLFVKLRVNR